MTIEQIQTNLEDIDCTEEQIQQFLTYLQQKDMKRMNIFLKTYRYHLLDIIHSEQKKLDYLDYLAYSLKKEGLN